MKKIITVIGARPQIIKAAAISRAIKNNFSDKIIEVIIHTGQHYDENMSQIFFEELEKLKKIVKLRPDKTFYVSQIGGGLANKFRIWELLIRDNLVRSLENFSNVVFCWEDNLV